MQATWITRHARPAAEKSVIVFAAGWAGSNQLVRHLPLPAGHDLLCLFDYRTLPSATELRALVSELSPYRQRHLIAWSFGVWAASQLFQQAPLEWTTATAIGGTPRPIDDTYGIPARAFAVTVRSIGGAGITKFLERMCGTPEILREYYRHRSTRPLDEIYDELTSLQRQALAEAPAPPAASFWTRAIVGGHDAIFPPDNMERYWNEARVPVTLRPDMPHYPLYESGIFTSAVSDETR